MAERNAASSSTTSTRSGISTSSQDLLRRPSGRARPDLGARGARLRKRLLGVARTKRHTVLFQARRVLREGRIRAAPTGPAATARAAAPAQPAGRELAAARRERL